MHALLALYVYPTHTLFLGPLEFIADTGASLLEYFLSKLLKQFFPPGLPSVILLTLPP